jgi:hypothetical protein
MGLDFWAKVQLYRLKFYFVGNNFFITATENEICLDTSLYDEAEDREYSR